MNMQDISPDMRDLLQLLLQYDVQFALCGGFAVSYHGFIRTTMDLDLLIRPSPENARRMMQALAAFAESVSHESAAREAVDGYRPVVRKRQFGTFIAAGIAVRALAGLDLLFQAMQHAREHISHDEVGIGVCTGHAMFQAAIRGVRVRNAYRHATIVHAPRRLQRDVAFTPKAAIAVRVRRENRHAVGHRLE